MYDCILPLVGSLILIICVLVGVAFLTLLERKVLGYIQIRKGPNKVGFAGIPQPFVMLLNYLQSSKLILLFLIIYLIIFLLFLVYFCLYWCEYLYLIYVEYMALIWVYYFFCVVLVYGFMLLWLLVDLLILIMLYYAVCAELPKLFLMKYVYLYFYYLLFFYWSDIVYLNLLNIKNMFDSYSYYFPWLWDDYLLVYLKLIVLLLILLKGSQNYFLGFNVEYSSGGFALIFLAEYASILFMSMLFSAIFLGCDIYTWGFFIKLSFISFVFIWVRGTLPRFRYDKLMYLAWKSFLPLSLNYLFLLVGVKILFMSILF
uniref:NADH-ubiquinone oxidoreductase chain 1 n=1 Tax=Sweltsa longistyla TaxID=1572085 RepID=A0A0C4Y3C0_9NEOP|nr:NADH dehydrogenase subunit 1 [Sweltsa longistyla]